MSSESVPHPTNLHSLQAISRLPPVKNSEYSVLAYVLNRDMINADGSLDPLHGIVYHLGSFPSTKQASAHAKNIIASTGHPAVIVAGYGMPVRLTTDFKDKPITAVPVDLRGKIVELESQQYANDKALYEQRMVKDKELELESQAEEDPDHIEHFKRVAYLALQARSQYEKHKRNMDTAWTNYKKHEAAVREHYLAHPSHEADWLPYLREKLVERGESNIYDGLAKAYADLRDELLDIHNVDELLDENFICEDGVCRLVRSEDSDI